MFNSYRNWKDNVFWSGKFAESNHSNRFIDKEKDFDFMNGQSADRTQLFDSTNIYSIVQSLDRCAKNS